MGLLCEIKKMVYSKMFIAVFVICLAVNAFVIHKQAEKTNRRKTENEIAGYDKLYAELEAIGVLSEELENELRSKYNYYDALFMNRTFSLEYNPELYTGYDLSEYSLYKEICEKLDYMNSYESEILEARERARVNALYYRALENKELEEYNTAIFSYYTQREVTKFFRTKKWPTYLSYSFSNLMILVTLVMGISGSFSGEREKKMSQLIISSRYGKIRTFINKFFGILLLSVLITVVFCLEDFLLFVKEMKLVGFGEKLYSIETMKYTIYDMSIMEYILLQNIHKLVGVIVIATLFMLISVCTSSTLFSMVYSFVALLPFIVINEKQVPFNVVRLLQTYVDGQNMGISFIGSKPLLYSNYGLLTCGIMAVMCVILSYLIENYSYKIFRKERV